MGHPLRRLAAAGAAWVVLLAAPAAAHDATVTAADIVGSVLATTSTDPLASLARVALAVGGADPASLQPLADAVAARVPGVDAGQLVASWEATSPARRTAVLVALAQVGKPYLFGGAGPQGFDCSGLIRYAWHAGGVELAHYTGLQRLETTPTTAARLQPGDLVFNLPDDGDGHVMLYLGADHAVVDSPAEGMVVRVRQWATVTSFGAIAA